MSGPNNIMGKHGIWTQESGQGFGVCVCRGVGGSLEYNPGECSRFWQGRKAAVSGWEYTGF